MSKRCKLPKGAKTSLVSEMTAKDCHVGRQNPERGSAIAQNASTGQPTLHVNFAGSAILQAIAGGWKVGHCRQSPFEGEIAIAAVRSGM